GKMSRIVSDDAEIAATGLAEMTPGTGRAFLVEAFNQIQISRIDPSLTGGRAISVFDEKDDLRPFEDAKLHGHNATHALLAYFGMLAGHEWMADVLADDRIAPIARAAFIEESGAALIAEHDGEDFLFTTEGYEHYVDDLLVRMANPFLRDDCQRIGRDIERKLGWGDRLIGTIRLCLKHDVDPKRYAMAALAAHHLWQTDRERTADDLSALIALCQRHGADPDELANVMTTLANHRPQFQEFAASLAAQPPISNERMTR
ncbi:MAG: hypothetical protein AAF737_05725, partial [Pseudomonadota bacterium]